MAVEAKQSWSSSLSWCSSSSAACHSQAYGEDSSSDSAPREMKNKPGRKCYTTCLIFCLYRFRMCSFLHNPVLRTWKSTQKPVADVIRVRFLAGSSSSGCDWGINLTYATPFMCRCSVVQKVEKAGRKVFVLWMWFGYIYSSYIVRCSIGVSTYKACERKK